MEWNSFFAFHVILIGSVKGNVLDKSSHPDLNEMHAFPSEYATNHTENETHGKLAPNICSTYS